MAASVAIKIQIFSRQTHYMCAERISSKKTERSVTKPVADGSVCSPLLMTPSTFSQPPESRKTKYKHKLNQNEYLKMMTKLSKW